MSRSAARRLATSAAATPERPPARRTPHDERAASDGAPARGDRTTAPLLTALRSRTAQVHERLDRGLDLLSPALSLTRYRHVLEAFHGYYLPLEARLCAHDDEACASLAMHARRRAHLLDRDLRALGASDHDISRLPRCAALPASNDLPARLGSLYVIEGSTLGGLVVCRHLALRLGLSAGTGAAFFHGHGAATLARWHAFLRLLIDSARGPDVERRITQAAVDTFDTFERWLSDRGVLV